MTQLASTGKEHKMIEFIVFYFFQHFHPLVMIQIIYTYILNHFNNCIYDSSIESALGNWAQKFSKCIKQWKWEQWGKGQSLVWKFQ